MVAIEPALHNLVGRSQCRRHGQAWQPERLGEASTRDDRLLRAHRADADCFDAGSLERRNRGGHVGEVLVDENVGVSRGGTIGAAVDDARR